MPLHLSSLFEIVCLSNDLQSVCLLVSRRFCVGYWSPLWGTGVRGLMTRGLATLPQGKQVSLMVKDKVRIPQVSLGWISPWHRGALTRLKEQEGHPACKKLRVGLLMVTIW